MSCGSMLKVWMSLINCVSEQPLPKTKQKNPAKTKNGPERGNKSTIVVGDFQDFSLS